MIDPEMPEDELKLHMGEMTPREISLAREAIRRCNSQKGPGSNARVAIAAWQWAVRSRPNGGLVKS